MAGERKALTKRTDDGLPVHTATAAVANRIPQVVKLQTALITASAIRYIASSPASFVNKWYPGRMTSKEDDVLMTP
jgi:hypothetical protein